MHNIIIDIIAVEKDTMPKIPDSAISKGSTFLKASSFQPELSFGDKVPFTITGAHQETKQRDDSISYSVPVKGQVNGVAVEGNFSVNKTNMKMFVDVLGDNSDSWVGAKFTALVLPVRNPQTNSQVKGWNIIKESITKKAGAK